MEKPTDGEGEGKEKVVWKRHVEKAKKEQLTIGDGHPGRSGKRFRRDKEWEERF